MYVQYTPQITGVGGTSAALGCISQATRLPGQLDRYDSELQIKAYNRK